MATATNSPLHGESHWAAAHRAFAFSPQTPFCSPGGWFPVRLLCGATCSLPRQELSLQRAEGTISPRHSTQTQRSTQHGELGDPSREGQVPRAAPHPPSSTHPRTAQKGGGTSGGHLRDHAAQHDACAPPRPARRGRRARALPRARL